MKGNNMKKFYKVIGIDVSEAKRLKTNILPYQINQCFVLTEDEAKDLIKSGITLRDTGLIDDNYYKSGDTLKDWSSSFLYKFLIEHYNSLYNKSHQDLVLLNGSQDWDATDSCMSKIDRYRTVLNTLRASDSYENFICLINNNPENRYVNDDIVEFKRMMPLIFMEWVTEYTESIIGK
jgi:hypothetical protein